MKTKNDLVCDIHSLQVELADLRTENEKLKRKYDLFFWINKELMNEIFILQNKNRKLKEQ